MSRNVILLVDYGSNNSIHIAMFKKQLKNGGWAPGFIEGVFEKRLDLADSQIETAVREEVEGAANQAVFKKTCCKALLADSVIDNSGHWTYTYLQVFHLAGCMRKSS